MSEYLTNFYCAYAEWLVFGAPHGQPFDRDVGLCGNLCKYICDRTEDRDIRIDVQDEMKAQFRAAKLHQFYPFSPTIGFNRMHFYDAECDRYECHLNEDRIAWVRLHAMA